MLVLFVDDDQEEFEIFCEAIQTIRPNTACVNKYNGVEAILFLQQATRLPVIIYSTDVNPRNVGIGKKLGAKAYLTKPSSIPALIKLLSAVLD
jgi:CheY-like chemotaxis protein